MESAAPKGWLSFGLTFRLLFLLGGSAPQTPRNSQPSASLIHRFVKEFMYEGRGGAGGGALCFFELGLFFWGWGVYFLKLESNSANWAQILKFSSNLNNSQILKFSAIFNNLGQISIICRPP